VLFAAILLGMQLLPASHEPGQACRGQLENPVVVAQLFLGRDISGREPVTDNEWSEFVAAVVTQEFPQGFTVLDADGQWQDHVTKNIGRERTKLLFVSADAEPAFYEKVLRVAKEYQTRFQQKSVRVVATGGCAQVLK